MNAPAPITAPLLELDLLRTLSAIADTGNFSAAAEVVHRTPSAISMQVKKLEEQVGRALFIRDSRSVRLTHDGEVLLEHARRMLALNRDAVSQFIKPNLLGEVSLGAPDDASERFLPEVLNRFAETHPGIVVNVIVENTTRMIEMVRQKELDIALITCEAGFDDDKAEILYREQLVWAALAGGIAAEQNPLPISVWESGCVWRKAGLEGLAEQGRDWRIAFQSAHISGQRAAILADLAVAPIPVSSLGGKIVEARKSAGLPKLPKYALGMIMAPEPSAPVEAAADHLRARFALRQSG